mmetsp:Transcript_24540/g.72726  ORF Transcript_24540/g.72726 Transcript_24540/m.72726 type:complete len:208 (-) Transcript_24540:55-678(-)
MERQRACHDGAGARGHGARAQVWHHMHPKRSVHTIQRACLDHDVRAGTALFKRLEHQLDSALEAASIRIRLGKQLCGSQQHRHVGVVPARMHHARVLAASLKALGLLDRQRVDVGAQQDGWLAAANGRNDPGCGKTRLVFDVVLLQERLDVLRRLVFLESQLWDAVEVASRLYQPGLQAQRVVQHALHAFSRLARRHARRHKQHPKH